MSESQATTPKPSRVASVTVDQYAALGQKVRLDLGERRTVLVGHNGAGKSALLEAIVQGFENPFTAWWGGRRQEPRAFEMVLHAGDSQIDYRYRWSPVAPLSDASPSPEKDLNATEWTETLRVDGKVSWRLENGRAYWLEHPDGVLAPTGSSVLSNASLLKQHPEGATPQSPLMEKVKAVLIPCLFSTHVPAG